MTRYWPTSTVGPINRKPRLGASDIIN